MSIELKPHNKEAYEKIKEHLKISNRVAVIHPTGTGKMYIALKLIEDNNEKKALYIAPSNPILHDVKKTIFAEGMNMTDFPNLKRMTYQKLIRLTDEEIEKLEFDIIILDEFHHCGAPEWSKFVEKLLNINPNAIILGLSATPIRYLDGLRDMSDEMFENNVASEMTLEEAIEQGILPKSTYVTALYDCDVELKKYQENINEIKNEETREEAQNLFNDLSKEINENTENLPKLLAEHMKNKTGKYIIFCKNIHDMQEKMEQANKMFGSVNSNITVRGVSSKIKETDKILTEFENDNDENSLKLLYAVDMLNEGYHIKDLDGVVMMRPTFSPTIYTQQLGRALTAGGEKEIVVIDLVNNFDTCKIIEDFAERMRQYKGKEGTRTSKKENKSRISVIDKTKNFREIASKIDRLSKRRQVSLEEKIKILERFSETEEELTGHTMFEGYPVGKWAIEIRYKIKHMDKDENEKVHINPSEEQFERLVALGILYSKEKVLIDEKIEMLIQWRKKYPKAEIMSKIPEEILKEYCSTEEEYIAITEKYIEMQKYYTYIRVRKNNGELTKEQILKCKEGDVRGIFGYPTEIEEIAKKLGQSEKNIGHIINNYGTIDNFKNLYRTGELVNTDLALANSIFRKVIDIDFNPNNKKYDNLFIAIFRNSIKYKEIVLYSSEKLKEVLETLDSKEKYVIERRYGLKEDDLPKAFESIGKELGVSRERIRQREAKALRKLGGDLIRSGGYDFKKSNKLTEEEVKLIDELENNIYSSSIIFANNPYQMTQEDNKRDDILKGLELLKNMDKISKERRTLEEIRETQYPMNIKIEDLDLSIRAFNCLSRYGVRTLGDITKITRNKCMKIRNLGLISFEEVERKLEEYGLTFREEENLENTQENNEQEGIQDKMDTKIEDLDLSVRAYNGLYRAGKRTLRDITQTSREECMKIRNMGRRSSEEIEKKLEEYGLTFRGEENLENTQENIVLEEQSTEDEFLKEVVGYATKRVEVREQDKMAEELEEQYVEQVPKDEHAVDED